MNTSSCEFGDLILSYGNKNQADKPKLTNFPPELMSTLYLLTVDVSEKVGEKVSLESGSFPDERRRRRLGPIYKARHQEIGSIIRPRSRPSSTVFYSRVFKPLLPTCTRI